MNTDTLSYLPEPPAASPEEVRDRHADNRVAWNQGAAHYAAELDETIAFIRGGGEPAPHRARQPGRSARLVAGRHPPAVRLGPRYAVAVERGRGASGGRRYLRCAYRQCPAIERSDQRAGDLVLLRCTRHAA